MHHALWIILLAGCGGSVSSSPQTTTVDDVPALIMANLGSSCMFAGPSPICGPLQIFSDPVVAEWPDAGAWNCYQQQPSDQIGICAFRCSGPQQVALCTQVGGHCAPAVEGSICEK